MLRLQTVMSIVVFRCRFCVSRFFLYSAVRIKCFHKIGCQKEKSTTTENGATQCALVLPQRARLSRVLQNIYSLDCVTRPRKANAPREKCYSLKTLQSSRECSSVWYTPKRVAVCLLFKHIFKQVFLQRVLHTNSVWYSGLNAWCKVEMLKLYGARPKLARHQVHFHSVVAIIYLLHRRTVFHFALLYKRSRHLDGRIGWYRRHRGRYITDILWWRATHIC